MSSRDTVLRIFGMFAVLTVACDGRSQPSGEGSRGSLHPFAGEGRRRIPGAAPGLWTVQNDERDLGAAQGWCKPVDVDVDVLF